MILQEDAVALRVGICTIQVLHALQTVISRSDVHSAISIIRPVRASPMLGLYLYFVFNVAAIICLLSDADAARAVTCIMQQLRAWRIALTSIEQ